MTFPCKRSKTILGGPECSRSRRSKHHSGPVSCHLERLWHAQRLVLTKKIFTLVYVGPINFLSWAKKGFWWVWVKLMWLLSWVDGASTILVQFPVTLSDSDTLRDCFWQEKFFTSVDVGLRKCKCKCPPGVSQVPADGGLPTLESFLPILWVDFFSHVSLLSCCNTPRKYQLTLYCATWHDVTSKF